MRTLNIETQTYYTMQFTEEELIELKKFIPLQEGGLLAGIRSNIRFALEASGKYEQEKIYNYARKMIKKEDCNV